ncbi:MAG TPA: ABC transporter permease [Vicinamibacterales bacterium]|nr:ABC transporter permease [Vicinamibacterales bacterium]
MQTTVHDVRYAARLLLKTPGFSAVAVVVLALGIGANTAVFTIINALVFQPIPSEAPGIVGIYNRDTTRPDSYRPFSWQEFRQIRTGSPVFDDVLAHTMTMVGMTEGDQTRRSFSSIVTANYFRVLDVRLAAGREFTAEEERPGSDIPVVIVGHQMARKAGVDPAALLGSALRLNARDYTIVGVTPEGFSGTMALVAPELWLPTGVYERVSDEAFTEGPRKALGDPVTRELMLVGRMKAGLTERSAEPMLAAVSKQLQEGDPERKGSHALLVHKLPRTAVSTAPHDDTIGGTLSVLLMGMAGLVLLISCLNLANMLLARGSSRRKEVALRLALGSGRARVVRQLLVESLLLAIVGGAAGLVLSVWGTRLLTATFAAVLPLVVTFQATPDLRVLAATLGFAVLSTVVAGLGPAWRVTRPDVLPDLKEQPADHGAGRRFSMRNALVVGQVALSLALLTAAGLFMRGAVKAAVADPGFPLEGGVIAAVDPALGGYDELRSRHAFRNILHRVRTTPGVQSASLASSVPFGEFRSGRLVQKAGTPPAPEGQRELGVDATYTVIGADYFDAMRLPVLRGRGFTAEEEDSAGGPPTAVIDQPLARQLFGPEEPLGQRIQFGRGDAAKKIEYEIVGVVAGVRQDLFDRTPTPHVYVAFGTNYRGSMNLHVRIPGASETAEIAMLGTLRQIIRDVDAGVPVMSLKTLRQHRDGSIPLWAVNTGARLFTVFGLVALVLAVIGVYGVKSYVVSRRTREIGIRMALGATSRDVLQLVLREGVALTAVGIALGLLLAWAVAQGISGMLYEVSALDPVVFATAPLLLTASALAATYLPARRAAHVTPVTALRSE